MLVAISDPKPGLSKSVQIPHTKDEGAVLQIAQLQRLQPCPHSLLCIFTQSLAPYDVGASYSLYHTANKTDPKTDNKENSRAVSVYYEEQNLLGFLRITIVTRFIGIENMDANSTTTTSHKLFQTHHLPPHRGDFLSKVLLQLLPPLQTVSYHNTTMP